MSKVIDVTKKLVWGLALMSSISCLIRNDFNIIFAFFILMILNNYYENNTKLFTKIIFQIVGLMIVLDLFWFIVMKTVWNKDLDNPYWKGQSTLRAVALIFCWLQIALKGFIAFYLFVDFKGKNPNETAFLFNFNYKANQNQQVEKQTAQGGDDWNRNPYDN